MMKKLWISSSVAVCLLWSTAAAFAAVGSGAPGSALLPEVAQILNPKEPDLAVLKEDAYVGLLAINAPEGMDYMTIGSQVVLNNFRHIQKILAEIDYEADQGGGDHPEKHYDGKKPLELDFDIAGESYKFPCKDLYAYQCVTQVMDEKEHIRGLISRNALLMERYKQIMQLPYYNAYFYSLADSVPGYPNWVALSNLRLGQAILAFEAGHADEGFTLLQEEMAFAKSVLSRNGAMLDNTVAQHRIYTIYHVISSMLDTKLLSPYWGDERLSVLLVPLSEAEQKALAHMFEHERNTFLYAIYTARNLEQEAPPETLTEQLALDIGYNREITSNVFYLMYEPVIERASLSLAEISARYMENTHGDLQEDMLNVLEEQGRLFAGHSSLFNKAGWSLMQEAVFLPGAESRLYRFYDLQTYMALVYAKFELLKAKVDPDQVGEFLRAHQELARSPYTQEPFKWDAKAQILSVPWINSQSPEAQGRDEMFVFIRLKN